MTISNIDTGTKTILRQLGVTLREERLNIETGEWTKVRDHEALIDPGDGWHLRQARTARNAVGQLVPIEQISAITRNSLPLPDRRYRVIDPRGHKPERLYRAIAFSEQEQLTGLWTTDLQTMVI